MILSIIIPVYKVEKYVRQTLESIYNQLHDESEFEVVVVDNGTPDNSMTIVKDYSAKHQNLHIATIKINKGLSLGRNRGIEDAKGDYLWHVDSDDTIAQNSLRFVCDLLKTHREVDLFGFDIIKVREDNGEEQKSAIIPRNKTAFYNKVVPADIVCPFVQGPVQRFIFKREFVEKNHLYFYPEIQHEDMEYLPKAYYFARNVFISDTPIYRYLLRNTGSLTSSLSPKSYPDRVKIMELLTSYKKNDKAFTKANRMMDLFIFWIAFFLLSPDKFTIEHQSDFLDFISDNKNKIKKAALRGIIPLWHFKEFKHIPLALMLWMNPLSIYTCYYRKEIKRKQNE